MYIFIILFYLFFLKFFFIFFFKFFIFFKILKSLILTCVPKHEPPSHLPPHNISLGHPHAPAPSMLYPASEIDWRFNSYMIVYKNRQWASFGLCAVICQSVVYSTLENILGVWRDNEKTRRTACSFTGNDHQILL